MSDNFIKQVADRALSGLKNVIGRGRVQKTDDSGPVQMIQVRMSAIELMDIMRVAEFGFTSRIPPGGDVSAIFLSGVRTWGVTVASNHQKYRLKLDNDGEAALYDAFGKYIKLGKDGITIDAGGKPITINNASILNINFNNDLVLNMGGKNVTINNPGAVNLTGAGGRKVVCDGDPVTGGVVHAAAGQKVTAT